MAHFFGSIFLIIVFIALLPILTQANIPFIKFNNTGNAPMTQADIKLITKTCSTTTDPGYCRSILNRLLQRKDVEKDLYGFLFLTCEFSWKTVQTTRLKLYDLMREAGENPIARMVVELCKNKYEEAENSFRAAVGLAKNRYSKDAMVNVMDGQNKVNDCDRVQNTTLLFISHREIVKLVDISIAASKLIPQK
ncbi:uncharacterized protein LOC126662077 [Mercurialis annua]|uniref:uncharacterized protein LOC126662077 n=1 Tax=Mercurialis annua TaxID=3986 RepID=UPI002160F96B|nr:uncharacterized protein LOC126662077 [Mercurialis annua]